MYYQSVSRCLLLALCGTLFGCKEPAAQAPAAKESFPVKMATVGAIQAFDYRYYPAKIRSSQRVKLAFQVAGQIVKFPLKAGDMVHKGQVLGELDSRDYENTYKSAVATYTESKSDYERYNQLVGKEAVSVATFQEKRKTYEVAEAAMKIAKKALDDTKLVAPFDGVVASTYVDNFQDIQAKQEILSLQGTSDIELIIHIPEKDVIRTPAKQSHREYTEKTHPVAIFPALGKQTFPLQFQEFEAEADASTQAFKAILTMPAPQNYCIRPGMTAIVKLVDSLVSEETLGYWVPASSVAEDNQGHAYVWKVDTQQTVRKCQVTLGRMDSERVVITSGLKQGDVIAASGIHFLVEGMTVREITNIGDRTVAATVRVNP